MESSGADSHASGCSTMDSADEGRRLYIGNLAYATTEGELKDFFKNYLVESVSIPENPRTDHAVTPQVSRNSAHDLVPKPSHADRTYLDKYGVRSSCGGGRSNARDTIAQVAAGAMTEKWLEAIENRTGVTKLPLRPGGFSVESTVTVEPPRQADLQKCYAAVTTPDPKPLGWYGAMINTLGSIIATEGPMSNCVVIPNAFNFGRLSSASRADLVDAAFGAPEDLGSLESPNTERRVHLDRTGHYTYSHVYEHGTGGDKLQLAATDPELRDWLEPFDENIMIYKEYKLRTEAGKPALLEWPRVWRTTSGQDVVWTSEQSRWMLGSVTTKSRAETEAGNHQWPGTVISTGRLRSAGHLKLYAGLGMPLAVAALTITTKSMYLGLRIGAAAAVTVSACAIPPLRTNEGIALGYCVGAYSVWAAAFTAVFVTMVVRRKPGLHRRLFTCLAVILAIHLMGSLARDLSTINGITIWGPLALTVSVYLTSVLFEAKFEVAIPETDRVLELVGNLGGTSN